MSLFDVANIVGLLAFAVSGIYKGKKKNLDLLGVITLGFITALGGGILRDITVNRTPIALLSITDVSFTFIGISAGILFIMLDIDVDSSKLVKIFDAVGLAAFTITGATVGVESGLHLIGIILLATLTGTGGGMIGDVLIGEVPSVLKEDIYATCSILGAVLLVLLLKIEFSFNVAAFITMFFILSLRLLAISKNWHLPKV